MIAAPASDVVAVFPGPKAQQADGVSVHIELVLSDKTETNRTGEFDGRLPIRRDCALWGVR